MPQNKLEVLVRKHVVAAKAVGMILLSILVVVIAIVPTYGKVTELQKQLKTKQKELDILSKKVVVLDGMDEKVLDERIDVLNKVLPPRKDILAYLSTIDGLSRELNLSLGEISISPGQIYESTESGTQAAVKKQNIVSGLSIIETEASIMGSEENIYEFLRQVESTAPLLKVSDINMTKVEGAQDDLFKLTLQLAMVYSLKGMSAENLQGAVSLFDTDEEKVYSLVAGFKTFELVSDSVGEVTTGEKENIFLSPTQSLPVNLPQTSPEESPLPEEEPLQE